ncbi:hypothetical protein CsSME_00033601 [Camellia sinensis var. sinensis]
MSLAVLPDLRDSPIMLVKNLFISILLLFFFHNVFLLYNN